jgi:hypothetical protein
VLQPWGGAAVEPEGPVGDLHRYLLTGLVVCNVCGRWGDAHWLHGRAGYVRGRTHDSPASGSGTTIRADVRCPVRVRRLSDHEGQRLRQIVRRGTGSPIRLRRAMVVMASAGGNTVQVIAKLVQADGDDREEDQEHEVGRQRHAIVVSWCQLMSMGRPPCVPAPLAVDVERDIGLVQPAAAGVARPGGPRRDR